MQGRVYACRNTLQFFTIPIGYLTGGALIDKFFEPLISQRSDESLLVSIFGNEKGSGAAMFLAFLGFSGVVICVIFSLLLHRENADKFI